MFCHFSKAVRILVLIPLFIAGSTFANLDSLEDGPAPDSCLALSNSMQEFRGSAQGTYGKLIELSKQLVMNFETWDQQLSSWEGDTVEVPVGTFQFINLAVENLNQEATNIEEEAFLLEDSLILLEEEVQRCRPDLEEKLIDLSDNVVNHITEAHGFISAVIQTTTSWYIEWQKLEGVDSVVTFPAGTFNRVKTYQEISLRGQRFIKGNTEKILEWIDEIIKELKEPKGRS